MTVLEMKFRVSKRIFSNLCMNCKSIYKFNEEMKFEIIYSGNDKLGVKFGIKIKQNGKWMLLVEDIVQSQILIQ